MNFDSDKIAALVTSYREKHSITFSEMAELIGVGRNSLYDWINGVKEPRPIYVYRMAKLFNCRMEDFYHESQV